MLAVVQRVTSARCVVDEKITGSIGKGIVVFLAIGRNDELKDAQWIVKKIVNLRLFNDDNYNKMNLSLLQIKGEVLLIPQFTLYGDCRKGYRPSFSQAASFEMAREMFSRVVDFLSEYPVRVATGVFGARMKVELENDGPVTLILSSDDKFRREVDE